MKSKLLNRNSYIMILSLLIVGCLILIPVSHYNTQLETALNKGWYFYKDKVHVVEEPIQSVKSLSLYEVLGINNSEEGMNTSVPSEPIGNLRVTSQLANVRTTPEIPADPESNIYGQIEQGAELPYYGQETNDDGAVWYMLMNVDTEEFYWIGGTTVEIAE